MKHMITRRGGNDTGLPAVQAEPVLPVPAPLPSLATALSRRRAIFGAAALATIPAAVAGSALSLAAGVAPVLAAPVAVDPDAALIDFTGRVERLARRRERVYCDMVDAQGRLDSWNFANRPREPKWPKVPSRMIGTDLSTSTHRVMQWSEPLEPDPAQVAVDAAVRDYRSACEAHRRAVEAREAASRVPYLRKLSARMWRRLIRDVDRLADMVPTTGAGLAAKASVVVALAETESDVADWWGHNLIRAVAEDAVRLGRGSVHA